MADLPDLLPYIEDVSDEQLEKIAFIHEAAETHNVAALRPLLRTREDANILQPTTQQTPLHTAISSYKPTPKQANGDSGSKEDDSQSEPIDPAEVAAVKTIKYLLQNGAIWNVLDVNNETPGCIAHRLGFEVLYEVMVDAGVRAELLFNTLNGYEKLDDDDDEEEGEDATMEEPTGEAEEVSEAADAEVPELTERAVNSENYFSSDLQISDSKILDSDLNGVMMAWEKPIMELTASLLLPSPGLRVLNVGHGMGIIDELFQSHSPSSHHIIEAHPDVLTQIKSSGWPSKPNVTIHEGKWQDILPNLVEQGIEFDAIYFDTFAEPYSALKLFFSEYVPSLLSQLGEGDDGKGGRWGFFHGLGADRRICYDVYTKVVEMDMAETGFDTEWRDVPVQDLDEKGEWQGVRRKYWDLDTYRLPISRWVD